MLGFCLYMAGVGVFILGVLALLMLDTEAGREAKRKGVIR